MEKGTQSAEEGSQTTKCTIEDILLVTHAMRAVGENSATLGPWAQRVKNRVVELMTKDMLS